MNEIDEEVMDIEAEPVEPVESMDSAEPAPATSVALVAVQGDSYMERLATQSDALEIFTRRIEIAEKARIVAIRRTRPTDWVLSKAKEASIDDSFAMLRSSGAQLVAEVYGISLENVGPRDARGVFCPDEVHEDDGSSTLRASAVAICRLNGRQLEIEASRNSKEDFTGRGVIKNTSKGVAKSDLRAATMTLMMTKAVRKLAGMERVPVSDLKQAWAGTGKAIEQCEKGSGFRSDGDQQRSSGAPQQAPQTSGGATPEALWIEIEKRVGKDPVACVDLLKEVTSFKKSDGSIFPGYSSWDRIKSSNMVENAFRNLRNHPVFGDKKEK